MQYPSRGSRPRGPLNDEWLFADPMAIELTGGDDARAPCTWPAAAASRPARWRHRLAVCVLAFTAGAAAGGATSGLWRDDAVQAAVICPPGHAARTGPRALTPGYRGTDSSVRRYPS